MQYKLIAVTCIFERKHKNSLKRQKSWAICLHISDTRPNRSLQILNQQTKINQFSNLFVHYVDLYRVSSRLLLRSASDSSMAKKSSFKARVE